MGSGEAEEMRRWGTKSGEAGKREVGKLGSKLQGARNEKKKTGSNCWEGEIYK